MGYGFYNPHMLHAYSMFLSKWDISLKGIFRQYRNIFSSCCILHIVQNWRSNPYHRFQVFLFILSQVKSEQGGFLSSFLQNVLLLNLVVEVTVFEVWKTRASLEATLDFVSLRSTLPFWVRAWGSEFAVSKEASW